MSATGRAIGTMVIVGGVVALGAVGIAWAVRSARSPALASTQNPTTSDAEMAEIVRDMRIAPFAGEDHRGSAVDAGMFRDRWTVVSFGFIHCTLVCPMLHSEIHRMAERLDGHGVRFVTFTVDPAHDTTAAMARHVEQWAMPGDAWTFVRTDGDALSGVLAGLQLGELSVDASNPIVLTGGETIPNILHPTRFFVVGPDGAVKGMWRGSDPASVDALIRWLMDRAR